MPSLPLGASPLGAPPVGTLPVGGLAIRRDVFRGRVWTESPTRVLRTGPGMLTTAIWPGVRARRSTSLIAAAEAADGARLRTTALDELAAGTFELGTWLWRDNSFVTEVIEGRWFTVTRIHAAAGPLLCLYVNFERPPVWRPDGWETLDLAVDLVVEPDGRKRWKDEDEYAHGRRLGLISDAEHAAVEQARGQALAQVEQRAGMFGEDLTALWRPDPDWPLPELPVPRCAAAGAVRPFRAHSIG